MLVCSVSMRPHRRAIAADLAEAATAIDGATTGFVVFATLVDDPGSANDAIDAFLGEVMVEAASATDSTAIGLVYATDSVEAATAADAPTATIVPGVNTTWNAGDATNIALSNGNLTAQASAAAQASVRATVSKTSGKYYFEVTCAGTIQNSAVGISTASPGGSTLVPTASIFVNVANGLIFMNGGSTSFGSGGGAFVSGDVAGIAIDLGNQRAWFRKNGGIIPSAPWNNTSGADPATNTGGIDISSIFASAAAFPIVTFNSTGLSHTANFGPTFAFAAPSGFGPWS